MDYPTLSPDNFKLNKYRNQPWLYLYRNVLGSLSLWIAMFVLFDFEMKSSPIVIRLQLSEMIKKMNSIPTNLAMPKPYRKAVRLDKGIIGIFKSQPVYI